MRVVVTRERGKNESLRSWLPANADVSEVPLTSTRTFEIADVRGALRDLALHGTFQSLVVTSERSAPYVAVALESSAPEVRVYSVGAMTSDALRGVEVAVSGEGSGPAANLAPQITRGPVLVLGAMSMRSELGEALRARGLDVETLACYETVPLTLGEDAIERVRACDVLFIGAPSAWSVARAFVASHTWVVVPGVTTNEAVSADHERVIEGWGPHLRERLEALER